MQQIVLSVNGQRREAMVAPQQSLLQLLRDQLQLVGTKEGCSTGYCGACTVLIDGNAVNACLFFAVDADRREITTVEGLASSEDELHPLQTAFVEHGALQCGFCTPGMIMAALALLHNNPSPTEADVRAGLSGNICRCTGYQSIVHAVLAAAKQLRGRESAQSANEQRARLRSRA